MMHQKDIYTQIREDYIAGKIYNGGDIVLDRYTNEQYTVINRGTNYITVESSDKQTLRKWLDEVITTDNKIGLPVLQDGQIKFNNTITEHLDPLSVECLLDLYTESTDLFAWRQAIVNLDTAMAETDDDKKYTYLLRAEEFLNKIGCQLPLVEEEKSSTEQRKVSQMVVALLSSAITGLQLQKLKSPSDMIAFAIRQLRTAGLSKSQWDVIVPLLQTAKDLGVPVQLGSVPYSTMRESEEELILNFLGENIDDVVDDLNLDDINEAFDESEFGEDVDAEYISEVLSYAGRVALSRDFKARETSLATKRTRALKQVASSSKILSRARKLAVAMLKRRIFKKGADQFTLQDKERSERMLASRREVIARLATKLIPKVRQLQRKRLGQ
jgi:hypothetical protein